MPHRLSATVNSYNTMSQLSLVHCKFVQYHTSSLVRHSQNVQYYASPLVHCKLVQYYASPLVHCKLVQYYAALPKTASARFQSLRFAGRMSRIKRERCLWTVICANQTCTLSSRKKSIWLISASFTANWNLERSHFWDSLGPTDKETTRSIQRVSCRLVTIISVRLQPFTANPSASVQSDASKVFEHLSSCKGRRKEETERKKKTMMLITRTINLGHNVGM